MRKDKRGVLRGKCLKCEEYYEYETTVTASILCEYYGHRPVEHEPITSEEETLPAKKPRLEPIQEELETDLSCDGEGQVESIVNKLGSVSTSASLNFGDIFRAENTSTRPLKPSATKNHIPSSPHHDITEERVNVVEVVDVDTKLESQQLKANELAKKEPGVAFNIKRRQGKLFAECNVCSSEVAVGQANQDLSLLKLHIITLRHKFNVAISRSRSSEIPTEIQGLRNQIDGKFPKVFYSQGEEVLCRSCNTSFAISQRSLLFNLKQHVHLKDVAISRRPPALAQWLTLPHFSINQLTHKITANDLTQRVLVSNFVMDSFLNVSSIMSAIKNVTVNPKVPINDTKPGENNSNIFWYPEPHYRFVRICKESSKETTGTFRSSECLRCADVGTFKNDMCSACEAVPNLPSFKKRQLLRSERIGSDGKRNNSTIRNDFLSTFEMQQKLKEQKEKLDDKESQLFFLKSKNLKPRMRKRSLDEKLAEFARRGSMKAICHNLDKAAQNGYLKDRNTLVGVLQTVARKFHVGKNGGRYQSSFKLFLEVLLRWGGTRSNCDICSYQPLWARNSLHLSLAKPTF